jgi:predicted TIM-barrel fold metal-dependent hydrolase
MNLEIFDSLVHPECNDSSFRELQISMESSGINAAFAVSLPGQVELDHQKYFDLANTHKGLTPVASVCSTKSPEKELHKIQEIGYRHIKLHPRLLNKALEKDFNFYDSIFSWAASHGIVIFICTYNSWSIENLADQDPMNVLGRLIKQNPTGKYVLLHGGSTSLLKYYEYFRNIENVILDLSYTLLHFYQSSLINDIKFLMKNFDKRLLVGSDYPEFSHKIFEQALSELDAELPSEKIKNIVHHNGIKVRDGNF